MSNLILTRGAALDRYKSQAFYNVRGKQDDALQKGALMALDTLARECQANLELYQHDTKQDDAMSSTPTPNKTKTKRSGGSPAEVSKAANVAPSTVEKRKLFKASDVVRAKNLPSSAKPHGDEDDGEEAEECPFRGSKSAESGKRARTRTSLDPERDNHQEWRSLAEASEVCEKLARSGCI